MGWIVLLVSSVPGRLRLAAGAGCRAYSPVQQRGEPDLRQRQEALAGLLRVSELKVTVALPRIPVESANAAEAYTSTK